MTVTDSYSAPIRIGARCVVLPCVPFGNDNLQLHQVATITMRSRTQHAVLFDVARRAREETGCVVTSGYGPRYLHSTGQLHKGGPPTGVFLQIVDDTGEELPIPGQPFGFGRLIRAQAAGDYASLKERGRRVARARLEDL